MVFECSRTIDKVEVSAPVEETQQNDHSMFSIFEKAGETTQTKNRHGRRIETVGETPYNRFFSQDFFWGFRSDPFVHT
uniref:Uncharacterized protein n=1 Tax=Romanomermis culicivorax TaxID=13658 RepID=A0A915I796_ROMCU